MPKRHKQNKAASPSTNVAALKVKKTRLLLQIGECEMTIASYALRKEDLKKEFVKTHLEIKRREAK